MNNGLSLSLLLAAVMGLAGCKSVQGGELPPEKQLIGKWEGVATLLTIETEGNTPRSRSVSVSEGEWESKMNRTPPQMTYYEDHGYESIYTSLIDNEGRQVKDPVMQAGTWSMKGDTLFIQEPSLSVPESSFKLTFKGDEVELRSMMDIDGDGKADDSYWMLQRRMK